MTKKYFFFLFEILYKWNLISLLTIINVAISFQIVPFENICNF